MNKWGYAVISIGCVIIASAPLTTSNYTFMIMFGLFLVVGGIIMARKKAKR